MAVGPVIGYYYEWTTKSELWLSSLYRLPSSQQKFGQMTTLTN